MIFRLPVRSRLVRWGAESQKGGKESFGIKIPQLGNALGSLTKWIKSLMP